MFLSLVNDVCWNFYISLENEISKMTQTIVDQQMEIEISQEKISCLENSLADCSKNIDDKEKKVSLYQWFKIMTCGLKNANVFVHKINIIYKR